MNIPKPMTARVYVTHVNLLECKTLIYWESIVISNDFMEFNGILWGNNMDSMKFHCDVIQCIDLREDFQESPVPNPLDGVILDVPTM